MEHEYFACVHYRHTSPEDGYVYHTYTQSMSVLNHLEQIAAISKEWNDHVYISTETE